MKKHLLVLALFISATGFAQSYSLDWFKIAGGGGTSTNGQFSVSGTLGQPEAGGALTGGNYSLTGGFWSLISVIQTAGSPELSIVRSGDNVKIFWPSASPGFELQQNADLANGHWTASHYTMADDGTNKSIMVTTTAGNLFFRLKGP